MTWLLIVWTLTFTQPHYIFVMQDENACHELGMEFMRDSIHNAVPFEYHCMENTRLSVEVNVNDK